MPATNPPDATSTSRVLPQQVGHYQVVAKIGEGGMGEVYRARDTWLNRDVAVKVLPGAFAQDPNRMARFAREAQLLASLNHPKIAAIYGLEESGPARALVMELVEGPTLADRIRQGAIAPDEALGIARQIADALEYAHEHGVVHRDLKPANIKITAEDSVKILDFGLAKAVQAEAEPSNIADSPTISQMATEAGMLLGTAAYMSPEQAKGKAVDRRADIWAFGCVLYEMLTRCRAFEGGTTAEILAAVLRSEPDWTRLPAETPDQVRVLLKRCLQKDPRQRLRDIGDARIAIEEALGAGASAFGGGGQAVEVRDARGRSGSALSRGLPWVVAAGLLVVSAAVAVVYFRQGSRPETEVRAIITPPEKMPFAFEVPAGAPVLSPDGTRLVFPAYDNSGNEALWLRPLNSLVAQRLQGTEGATFPFWAPDSRQLGFFANGKLNKIDVTGGPPVVICDAANGRGGAWNRNGLILFAPAQIGGLVSVSAAGGVPAAAAAKPTGTEGDERWPDFLPDGEHYLYLGGDLDAPGTSKLGIYVGRLGSTQARFLLQADSDALYAAPGYVLFVRGDALMAQKFDAGSVKLKGDAFPVAEHIASPRSYRLGIFGVSQTGLLVYSTGEAGSGGYGQLVWVDAEGKELGKVGPTNAALPRISPDGKMVAYDSAPQGTSSDIWLKDLSRGVETRFSFGPAISTSAVWSPDGSRIAYGSGSTNAAEILVKEASGAGEPEVVLKLDGHAAVIPTSWSSDGRYMLCGYVSLEGKSKRQIWVLPLFGDRKPFRYLQTPFSERVGAFSPDGRWVAYMSDESGKMEVYVSTFPAGGSKWQISQGGAIEPQWGRDGKEIYYEAPTGGVMEASVTQKGNALEIGAPHELFRVSAELLGGRGFAVARDGKRFLMVEAQPGASQPLTLVTNWTAGLEK